MIVRPDGPTDARVMIVGEAPGEEEERRGIPFCGVSGYELARMLVEAGLSRSAAFVTNVARSRPRGNDISAFIAKSKKDITPAHTKVRDKWVTKEIVEGYELLKKEIELVNPKIIITLGNVSMWALTGRWGITKWRGSMLATTDWGSTAPGVAARVIPTYHPAAILREWSWRAIAINDLRRAKRFSNGADYSKPQWNFILRPTYEQTINTLDRLYLRCFHREPLRVAFDLETRAGHIACAGLAWSTTEALCIPFMAVERPEGYWDLEQESEIVWRLRQLLTHPKIEVVGQNLLYDCQYTWRHWHFVPTVTQDTMISQHAIFSDMPKSLGFLASMYCDYFVYWKDEGKDWEAGLGEDQLWNYNCLDCVYTLEVSHAQRRVVEQLGLDSVHSAQQAMFWPVLQAMQRGVRIDKERRNELILEVQEAVALRQQFLLDVLGHPLNAESPKQMMALFYDDLKMPVQMTRAAKGKPARPTLDDEALQKLVRIQPLLHPIITAIADIRTLGKFLSNFLCRPLSEDGRMRCSYNIGGSASGKSAPKTYRLSSSEDAFGSGTNLQTIPSEKSRSIGKAAARGPIAVLGNPYLFPNIRQIFIPDPGCTWLDLDLDRADLHVVCWEAEDDQLKSAMRMGVDIHLLNAYVLGGKEPPAMEELVEGHSKYLGHFEKLKHERQFAKVFVHGTNYGGKSRTMASGTNRTVHEVDRAQRRWFGAHPGILRWHARVNAQVTRERFVQNRFDYRWYIFDRVDNILPEALAWIPQSTVSITINRIWLNIYEHLPDVQVLMQCHDSLCVQVPTSRITEFLPKVREAARVTVPYDDPLVIPVSVKTSEKSWGDC